PGVLAFSGRAPGFLLVGSGGVAVVEQVALLHLALSAEPRLGLLEAVSHRMAQVLHDLPAALKPELGRVQEVLVLEEEVDEETGGLHPNRHPAAQLLAP